MMGKCMVCVAKGRNCYADSHRRRARTRVEDECNSCEWKNVRSRGRQHTGQQWTELQAVRSGSAAVGFA